MRHLPGLFLALAAASVAWLPTSAAERKPEIARPAAAPQAVGHAHGLRTIPEACIRLQGEFTGDATSPYRFEALRSSPSCQARARVVAAAKAGAPGPGWILNDRIRVPSAACPGQAAVVRVWRQQESQASAALDAQGKSRIYLEEGLKKAKAGKLAALPAYAVAMTLEGKPCK